MKWSYGRDSEGSKGVISVYFASNPQFGGTEKKYKRRALKDF